MKLLLQFYIMITLSNYVNVALIFFATVIITAKAHVHHATQYVAKTIATRLYSLFADE